MQGFPFSSRLIAIFQPAFFGGLALFIASCSGGGGASSSASNNSSYCQSDDIERGVSIAQVELKEAQLLAAGAAEFDLNFSLKNCFGADISKISLLELTALNIEIVQLENLSITELKKESSSDLKKAGRFRRVGSSSDGQIRLKVDVDGVEKEIVKDVDLRSVAKPELKISSVEVLVEAGAKATNENLLIDHGERVSFKVEAENPSLVRLESLGVTVESSNTLFAVENSQALEFGILNGNEKKATSSRLVLVVDPNTARGSASNVKLTFKDKFNNEWEKVIPFVVTNTIPDLVGNKAALQISNGALNSNGDELIDAGEKVTFVPTVSNSSALLAKNVQVKVSSNSEYFVIKSGSDFSLGDLAGFSNNQAASPTEIDVSSGAPRGAAATVTYDITNEYGDHWTYSFMLQTNPNPPTPRKTQVLNLRAGMEAIGFTSDASSWYLLARENFGGGVYYYSIYKKAPSASQFAFVCGVVEEHVLNYHLAVDESYFYLSEDFGFRRIDKNSCLTNSKYSVATAPSSNAMLFSSSSRFSLNVSNGKILYLNDLQNVGFSSFSLITAQSVNHASSLNYLGKTLNFSTAMVTGYRDIKWAYDPSNKLMWNLNDNLEALSFGNLPTNLQSLFDHAKVMTSQDGDVMVVLSQDPSGTLKLTSVNVSQWQEGADQKMSGNVAEESISIGNPIFMGCGSGRLTTSTPGCAGVSSVGTLALGSDIQFRGMTSDASGIYLLTIENLGNGVKHQRIYRRNFGENNFSLQCSLLDDGVVRTGIATDENYYYLSSSGQVERFNKGNCNYYSKMSFSFTSSRPISFEGGRIFYSASSNPYDLKSRGFDGTGPFDHATYQIQGLRTLSPNNSIFYVKDGIRWVFDRDSRSLWKLDSSNKAVGWVYFNPNSYADLNDVKAMAMTDNQSLLIASEPTAGTLKLIEVSVSDFGLATGNQSGLSASVVTPILNRTAISCPAGSFATSSSGCMAIIGNSSFSVPSGSSFVGFSADEGNLYVAIRNMFTDVFSISSYNPVNSNLNGICSIADESLKANLGVGLSQFFVGKFYSFAVINKSTCAVDPEIVPSGGLSTWSASFAANYPFTLTSSNGNIYYSRSGNPSDYGLYELSSGAVVTLVTNQQSLGSKTFDSSKSRLLVSGANIWAIDHANSMIWKLDSSYKPVSWAFLPVSQYPALSYIKGAATKDGQKIYIAVEATAGNIQVFELDLSAF